MLYRRRERTKETLASTSLAHVSTLFVRIPTRPLLSSTQVCRRPSSSEPRTDRSSIAHQPSASARPPLPYRDTSNMIMDNELLRAWLLVHELSDQLAHNQKMTSALQSRATSLKVPSTPSSLTRR
jgi:hypothetical protein